MFFLVLPLALFLSGCLNYTQEVSFNIDGSGTMNIHYWMKVTDPNNELAVQQLGLFNKDSIRSQFTSPYIEIEEIEAYADTTDTTSHVKIEFNFVHIDSLNFTRPFSEANFSLKEGAEGQLIFSQFITPMTTGFGFDGSEFRVKYVYDFPGEIIVHNATSQAKRKLIWEYTVAEIGKGKTISVTYRPYKLKETPVWIYALSGFVLLVVIIFLFRKRRK